MNHRTTTVAPTVTPPATCGGGYNIVDMSKYCSERQLPLTCFWKAPNNSALSIEQAKDIIFGPGVDSFNRVDVLLSLTDRIHAEQSHKLDFFRLVWPLCDGVYTATTDIIWALSQLAPEMEFYHILTDEEKLWIDGLDDEFVIYRGCDEGHIAGCSWTTDRTVAEAFANGFRGHKHQRPVVVTARCRLEYISFVTNDREEFEVVVNPSILENVTVQHWGESSTRPSVQQ